MNSEREKQWNIEFIQYLHHEALIPNNKHDDYFFIDFHYRREWLCYLAARKKAQEEIEITMPRLNAELEKRDKLLEQSFDLFMRACSENVPLFSSDRLKNLHKKMSEWLKKYGEMKR